MHKRIAAVIVLTMVASWAFPVFNGSSPSLASDVRLASGVDGGLLPPEPPVQLASGVDGGLLPPEPPVQLASGVDGGLLPPEPPVRLASGVDGGLSATSPLPGVSLA